MKLYFKILSLFSLLFLSTVLFSFIRPKSTEDRLSFPYRNAGLTERQAAAHLLDRFSFGARPGQVEEVVKIGLENWFLQQLNADKPEDVLNDHLKGYSALNMSNREIVNTYRKGGEVLKMAIRDGVINKDSVNKTQKAAYRTTLESYMLQKGIMPQKELFRQLANQKILRAAYAENQLQEVLTDFWFNHFNVSISKNNCAEYIPNYERDVIRPNVFGKFENLLIATAKSPAMLLYLDNFSSAATGTGTAKIAVAGNSKNRNRMSLMGMNDTLVTRILKGAKQRKKNQGLNENYAREVMELHTLGVEGGFTQSDVTEAARILTGWTIYPNGGNGAVNVMRRYLEKIGEDRLAEQGFIHDQDFLFAANRHDKGEKVVLGNTFKPTGYNEGLQLLKMLAHHPSTARFLSRKIATRFVNDHPSQGLVDKLAKTFIDKDADIKQVLLTMVHSPEFWSKAAVREKTKSPFELVISSVRSLDAEIKMPYQLYNWVDKMGQKMYFYQAPTGFPDKGEYWINTGSLLNRMNFGLALASGNVAGVRINLLKLNKGHEPESAEAALQIYSKILLPERDLDQTIKRLTPLLHDPQLQTKVENNVAKHPSLQQANSPEPGEDEMKMEPSKGRKEGLTNKKVQQNQTVNATMFSQVVGIIIGSPEFQRR